MYYLRFADLLTDADLCEISVPFSLDRRIIQPGTFSCSLEISNPDIGSVASKIVPQKTICHVYRDSLIIGSYIIWTKRIESERGRVKCSLQGATLESYLYSRRLYSDLTYNDVEQLSIAEDFIDLAQTGLIPYSSSANLGIVVHSSTSGVLRDRTYPASDGKYIGDLLEELANVDDGFEYVIHTGDDGTARTRDLYFGYPRISGTMNPFVIEEPGTITSWSITFDGTQGATAFWTRGSVSDEAGTGPILSDPAFAQTFLENGFPIIDSVTDYANVTDKYTLDMYAAWWAKNRSGPIFAPSFKVDAESMFRLGFNPMLLGSNFTYIMNNPAYPLADGVPTLAGTDRMIGFALNVSPTEVADMTILIETSFDPTEVL